MIFFNFKSNQNKLLNQAKSNVDKHSKKAYKTFIKEMNEEIKNRSKNGYRTTCFKIKSFEVKDEDVISHYEKQGFSVEKHQNEITISWR